jgi:ribosome recycling factor
MAMATFDTLKFANTLKAAGVPDKQAEAQAVAFAEIIQVNIGALTTKEDLDRASKTSKADLEQTAKDIRQDIKSLRDELKQEIKSLRDELKQEIKDESQKLHAQYLKLIGDVTLLKWMFGATFTGVVAALGLLIRLSFRLP